MLGKEYCCCCCKRLGLGTAVVKWCHDAENIALTEYRPRLLNYHMTVLLVIVGLSINQHPCPPYNDHIYPYNNHSYSNNYHTTRQPYDNRTTTTRQLHNNHTTTTRQPHDNHTTTVQQPHDNRTTTTRQPPERPPVF